MKIATVYFEYKNQTYKWFDFKVEDFEDFDCKNFQIGNVKDGNIHMGHDFTECVQVRGKFVDFQFNFHGVKFDENVTIAHFAPDRVWTKTTIKKY
jgi:hypothetical protein